MTATTTETMDTGETYDHGTSTHLDWIVFDQQVSLTEAYLDATDPRDIAGQQIRLADDLG